MGYLKMKSEMFSSVIQSECLFMYYFNTHAEAFCAIPRVSDSLVLRILSTL